MTPQHMKALALANEVRLGRAAIKREVRAGRTRIADLIVDPPEIVRPVTVGELLGWAPRVGPRRVRRLLMDRNGQIVRETCPIGHTSQFTRDRLASSAAGL